MLLVILGRLWLVEPRKALEAVGLGARHEILPGRILFSGRAEIDPAGHR